MRKKMWEEIPGRDHYPFQIFTHGHDEMELMVRGKAEHQHHSGDQVPHEWAAYYKLVEENGQIKFQQIHIILVSGLRGKCDVQGTNVVRTPPPILKY